MRSCSRTRTLLGALRTTLLVSVLAAVIATVLGTAAAIGFDNMRRRARTVCLAVNNIPLTNADIITGVSMMLLFVLAMGAFNGQLPQPRAAARWLTGFGTLLIAHITFNVPYVILSVMPKLRQLDPNIYEAAQDLGATGCTAFRKVILPEIMPGVLNGPLIAFTMSIDDFVISYFTAGSGVTTLSVVVYSMVNAGDARRSTPCPPSCLWWCSPCCSSSTSGRPGRRRRAQAARAELRPPRP